MKKIIGYTLCLIGLWIGLAVVFFIAGLFIFWAEPDSLENSELLRGMILSLNQIPALLTVWLVACKLDGRTLEEIGVKKHRWWLWLVLGAVCACLFYSLYWYLSVQLGYLQPSKLNRGFNGSLFIYLAGYFMVGLAEEWMCRGYLQTLFYQNMGRAASLIGPSALFTLLHLGTYGMNISAYISAFALGLLFSCMTWVTGSVWMAVGFHWLYNWMEVAFFGIEGEEYSVFTTALQNTNNWNILPSALVLVCLGIGAAIFLLFGRNDKRRASESLKMDKRRQTDESCSCNIEKGRR